MQRRSEPHLMRLARHATGLLDVAREVGDPELIARVEALAGQIRRSLSDGLARADGTAAGIASLKSGACGTKASN